MHIERKKDLSIYYWLRDIFSDHIDFITINDGYPDTALQRPSITVEAEMLLPVNYEMGNRTRLVGRLWSIDVIALNKDMRDEYTYKILEEMYSGIPVYDYDEGFPPDVSPTQIGTLRAEDIEAKPVRVFPELVEKMYWRELIRFTTKYYPI